jgi:septal ring factor EnvC (AmiA/AmiB activator)
MPRHNALVVLAKGQAMSEVTVEFPSEQSRARRAIVLTASAAGAVVLFLILAVVLVFTTLNNRIDQANRRLAKTQAALVETQAAVKQTGAKDITSIRGELAAATGSIASLNKQLVSARKQISLFGNCFPELQSELNGLGVGSTDVNGYLTGAYIQNNVQVSRVCQPVFYPTSNPAAPGD